MLFTVLSWIIIVIVFGGIGFGISKLIKKVFKYEVDGFHSAVMLGIVFSTVYAEAFSTVYKVGRLAFVVLSIVLFAALLYSGGEIYDHFCVEIEKAKNNKPRFFSLAVIFISMLFLASFVASRAPIGYDTMNYHVPDIRWLEEYGAVKGVGNLHPFFAYNSSFHCLQALFSFTWVGGTSYHSMNGFIWMFMTMHTVASLSFFADRRFGLSDVLRITFLWLLFGCISWGQNEPLASPITDFLPLCLVGYIFIEWCTLNEICESDEVPYGLLSILGMYAASVKLSAAILAFFAIKPCVDLIKKRRFNTLIVFICMGILVMGPFLIRNVIISGYLLYPVASLDLFDFDWEMPKSVVVTDGIGIKLFARNEGSFSYEKIQLSFSEWFKEWQRRHFPWHAMAALRNLIISPIVLVYSLYGMLRKKREMGNYDHIVFFEAAAGFVFLIFSAPSLRFGMIWLYFLPVVCAYGIIDRVSGYHVLGDSITELLKRSANRLGFAAIASFVILVCFANIQRFTLENEFDAKVIPKDYDHTKNDEYTYEISGVKFYYTYPDVNETDTDGIENLLGYDSFPGAANLACLKHVQFRGKNLVDGFRVRDEFINVPYEHHGRLLDNDTVKLLKLDKYYENK